MPPCSTRFSAGRTRRTGRFRLATRGSALALVQARMAAEALSRRHPDHEFVVEPIETRGDRAKSAPLTEAAQEGIFVKELEQALLEGRAELAVHSAKDLPTRMTPGLALAAFLPRADARDVLIGREAATLATLAAGARVGTGSPRRAAQLAAVRPDLKFVAIRGNVDTRIRRLREGMVDALVLAAAGVARLGRLDEVHEWLPFEVMLPAPGQGALALQARTGSAAEALAAELNDRDTSRAVRAERGVLSGLGGGCLSAVGAYAEVVEGALSLAAVVLAEDGRRVVRAKARGAQDSAVVDEVVSTLEADGAQQIIRRRAGAPLDGVRVMVTRAADQAGGFTQALERAGATVVACPVLVIEPMVASLVDVDSYDWIIFTSVNGVDRFFDLLGDRRLRHDVRLAAIGPETAAALHSHGLTPDVVPPRFVAEELARSLPEALVSGKRVLIPRAAGARDVLPGQLRASGARVDVLELYRAVAPKGLPQQLRARLQGGVDVVTFTSSSTVAHFMDALGNATALPAGVQVACIGPITAQTARERGLAVDIIAEEYTTRGLVDALVRHRAKTPA